MSACLNYIFHLREENDALSQKYVFQSAFHSSDAFLISTIQLQTTQDKKQNDVVGNLNTRGIEDGVLAGLHDEEATIVVNDATEGADDLGSGLQAPEEGGHDDAVDGDAGAAQPLPGGPRPDQAPLGERRVPWPLGVCHPQRLLVVDPVPVPHHPHVLHPYLFSPTRHCSLSLSLGVVTQRGLASRDAGY